ncbi:unnamed protein product [Arctogadus glacialis]
MIVSLQGALICIDLSPGSGLQGPLHIKTPPCQGMSPKTQRKEGRRGVRADRTGVLPDLRAEDGPTVRLKAPHPRPQSRRWAYRQTQGPPPQTSEQKMGLPSDSRPPTPDLRAEDGPTVRLKAPHHRVHPRPQSRRWAYRQTQGPPPQTSEQKMGLPSDSRPPTPDLRAEDGPTVRLKAPHHRVHPRPQSRRWAYRQTQGPPPPGSTPDLNKIGYG